MPAVFGYRRTPGRRSELADFADREGYSMVQTFVDSGGGRTALRSMIEAVAYHEVVAVLVPAMAHLGRDPQEQAEVRRRLQEEAGVPVLALHSS